MTALQVDMFEPQGADLASLVSRHISEGDAALRRASNLTDSFLPSAAAVYQLIAVRSFERAAVCESALQFESMAGLV